MYMAVKILSLDGVYPEESKVAVVKPLFKEGVFCFYHVENYRKWSSISYMSTSIGYSILNY